MGKKGFDVWYHKGTIDWQKVKASGIDFILPRDGWGTDSIDYKFIEYVQRAQAAGIEVPGVFHNISGRTMVISAHDLPVFFFFKYSHLFRSIFPGSQMVRDTSRIL